MGYCVYTPKSNLSIKKENMKSALKAIGNYIRKGNDFRWVNDENIVDMINNIDNYHDDNIVFDIWNELRYEIEEVDQSYMIMSFIGEKLGDDEKLFKLISLYCEDGYIEFLGEDGKRFRFAVSNGKFQTKYPTLVWE